MFINIGPQCSACAHTELVTEAIDEESRGSKDNELTTNKLRMKGSCRESECQIIFFFKFQKF